MSPLPCSVDPVWLAGSSMMNASEICMNRGVCIIDALCACDPAWTGRADYFPLNSCQNPVVLDKLMWSLCAASHLVLMFRARRGLWRQWDLHLQAQRDVAKFGPTRRRKRAYVSIFLAFLLMMLVLLPGLACVFIVRSVLDNLHFGVDLEITLPFVVLYSAYMCALSVIDHQLFAIMVAGAASSSGQGGGGGNAGAGIARSDELIRLDARNKLYGTSVYCAVYSGSMVASVFFPETPNAGRIVLLLLTNLATTVFFGQYYWAYTILISKMEQLLLQSSDKQQPPSSSSPPTPDDKEHDDTSGRTAFMNVLANIKFAAERAKKLMILLFVINVVFMAVPQLYAFTYVKNAFMMIMSTGSNHLLLTLSSGGGSFNDDGTDDGGGGSSKEELGALASASSPGSVVAAVLSSPPTATVAATPGVPQTVAS